MTDTTDINALKINTYSVNSNDAWPQCADDDRTGSYVKWDDLVKLLSDKSQGKDPETGFDSLKNLKFVADCCIENPDSIYASEFFLLLDEMFDKQGDYSMPVQAVAVSHLLDQLETERQRADAKDNAINFSTEIARKASEKIERLEAELAALKSDQVPVGIWRIQEVTGDEGGLSRTEFLSVADGVSIPKDAPLFAAPQKPVVLPPVRRFVNGYSIEETKAAIKAAGGIVKDGE